MPVVTSGSGDALTWIIILVVIGGQIMRAVKRVGQTLPKGTQPSDGTPSLEDFLRKLAQGENPIEEAQEQPRHVQPPPIPQKRIAGRTPAKEGGRRNPVVVRTSQPRQNVPPPPRQAMPRRVPVPSVPHVTAIKPDLQPMDVGKQAALLARTIHHDGIQARRIRTMLHHRETLKSAVLLREIIGPPAAASMARR